MMPPDHRGQRPHQVAGRITLGPAGGDGVAENSAAILESAMCSFIRAAGLDLTEDGEQFRRGDRFDCLIPEPGKDTELEPANDLVAVARRPLR
jgi:hypothetical protein